MWDDAWDDMWIVLRREPLIAYGGNFYTRALAEKFAQRHGGQVVELRSKWGDLIGVPDGADHLGAVWFNGNWDDPVAFWPFWDLAEAEAFRKEMGFGVAVEVEFVDDDDDGDGGKEEDAGWLVVWVQQRFRRLRAYDR